MLSEYTRLEHRQKLLNCFDEAEKDLREEHPNVPVEELRKMLFAGQMKKLDLAFALANSMDMDPTIIALAAYGLTTLQYDLQMRNASNSN